MPSNPTTSIPAPVDASRRRPPDVRSLGALRAARDRIDRDYGRPLAVAALAALAGYSRAHFIRAFRATYGETPGRYLARRRVERACELLRSANLTITEISVLVGFQSASALSARFAEVMGLPPGAYRREAARRGGPAPIPGCFALMWRTGLPAPRAAAPSPTPHFHASGPGPASLPSTASSGGVS